MARCFRRNLGANDRGAEALEFALILPVFLTLVFGIVDFGYMINRDTLINNASREGARQGSVNPDANAVECAVRRSLAGVEPINGAAANCRPSPTKITVTVTCRKPDNVTACTGTFPTDAVSGGTVIVKVDYTHLWITPVGSTIRSGGQPLSRTTEMRIE